MDIDKFKDTVKKPITGEERELNKDLLSLNRNKLLLFYKKNLSELKIYKRSKLN